MVVAKDKEVQAEESSKQKEALERFKASFEYQRLMAAVKSAREGKRKTDNNQDG